MNSNSQIVISQQGDYFALAFSIDCTENNSDFWEEIRRLISGGDLSFISIKGNAIILSCSAGKRHFVASEEELEMFEKMLKVYRRKNRSPGVTILKDELAFAC